MQRLLPHRWLDPAAKVAADMQIQQRQGRDEPETSTGQGSEQGEHQSTGRHCNAVVSRAVQPQHCQRYAAVQTCATRNRALSLT